MKRCPECRRDYYDDTLSFCLDDGATLLEGPAHDETKTRIFGAAHSTNINDEPQTAILSDSSKKAVTNLQINDNEKTAVLPIGKIEEARDKSYKPSIKILLG